MVGAVIKGIGAATEANSSKLSMSKLSKTTMSGTESFSKVMSKSLASNVNNNSSQNAMQKMTASSAGEKSDSVQQDIKTTGQKYDDSKTKNVSDKQQSESTKTDEKLTEAGEKVKEFLKEKFGVSDEELENIMAELGLCVQDLLQNANLTDLVVKLTGVESSVEIITNSELSECLTDVIDYAKQLISDIQSGNELTDVPVQNIEVMPDTDVKVNEEAGVIQKTEEFKKDEVQQSDSVPETNETLDKVLENKVTIETTQHKSSDSESRENGSSHSQTKDEAITQAAGNLSQSIQNVFSGEVQETMQVNPVEVVRQVVEAVKLVQKQSLQSIEIQLNPENLGKMHIAVSSRNSVITAEITTQNEQVKRAVETQMSMLKENLESQGIKIDAVEVTVQSHAFENGQNLQGNNSQQEKAEKESKRNLDLSSLDELSEDELSEDETAVKSAVMNENSSVEYTA